MVAEAKSSSRIFLISSLALGVLAMAAAFVFLQNTAGQEQGPKVKILVAKHDLRENAPLDPDKDFEELEIPQRLKDLQALALAPTFSASYKGQRVNRTVLAGQPLLLADLAATGTLELHGDGRALSISVKGANGLSGLVVPGDYVKLLVTRPTAAGRFGAATTSPADPPAPPGPSPALYETLVVAPMPFKVLAANQRLSRSRPQVTAAEAYQSSGESTANQTVTLEVTEAQAKNILEQTGAGQLPVTLLLCPPATTGTGTSGQASSAAGH